MHQWTRRVVSWTCHACVATVCINGRSCALCATCLIHWFAVPSPCVVVCRAQADSVSVYKGLDIGAAKPSPEDQLQIPHHLIDILPPTAYVHDHQPSHLHKRARTVCVCVCMSE